jgi:hypothetical protein
MKKATGVDIVKPTVFDFSTKARRTFNGNFAVSTTREDKKERTLNKQRHSNQD